MGQKYTEIYIWQQCPEWDPSNFDEYNLYTSTRLDEIKKRQNSFGYEHNIPIIPYAPKITKYQPITEFQSDVKDITFVRERMFHHGLGFLGYEFTFNTKQETPLFHQKFTIRVENHGIFSRAIHKKMTHCQTYQETRGEKLCPTCQTEIVRPIFKIYSMTSAKMFDNAILHYNIEPDQIFTHDKYHWVISKNIQLIKNTKIKKSRRHFYDVFIWTSLVAKGVSQFGKKQILRKIVQFPSIPTKTIPIVGDDPILNDLYRDFIFIHFWLHPRFIHDPHISWLGIRILEQKSLEYAYSRLIDESFWDDFQYIFKEFMRKPFLVKAHMYSFCLDLPVNTVANFLKELNPLETVLPEFAKKYNTMSQLAREVLWVMAQHTANVVEPSIYVNVKTGRKDHFIQRAALTANFIREKLGFSRGRKNEQIKEALDSLVENKIISVAKKNELNKKVTSGSKFYYIDPRLLYSRIILETMPKLEKDKKPF